MDAVSANMYFGRKGRGSCVACVDIKEPRLLCLRGLASTAEPLEEGDCGLGYAGCFLEGPSWRYNATCYGACDTTCSHQELVQARSAPSLLEQPGHQRFFR